jgi:putative ABC transport system ATP-binding protein
VYTLTNVTKNYQKGRHTVTALRGLNLAIDDGEWLAVQGRTGHGKTTLLQILGGLDRPGSGTVTFAGHDLAQLREVQVVRLRAESIGFVFQTFNLVPTLSAAENVESALIPLGTRPAQRRRRVTAVLESVGLGDRAGHLPGELSGGAGNHPSARLMERIGMRQEARFGPNQIVRGQWADELVYAILDHEWRARRL